MVPGFNHNVMHKGKLFHIQTEDRGMKTPEIVTHLFIGGNIIDSKRTSYEDIATAENLEDIVREMMEEQHKNMLRDLKNGSYDERIGGPPKPAAAPAAAAAAPAAAPAPAAADDGGKSLDEVILNYLSRDS